MKTRRFFFSTLFLILPVVISSFFPIASWAKDKNDSFSLKLIQPDALNRQRENFFILDARSKNSWQESHLPGAISLSWENYTRVDEKGIPYRMLPPKQMSEHLGNMGMDETSAIAIYGDADTSWGGEGWLAWIFAYLGHRGPVVILEGGIQAWKNNNLPLSQGNDARIKRAAKTYHAVPNPRIDITTEELSKSGKNIQIVDTRSLFERLRGSIPGSVHIKWTHFYTGDTRKPIAPNKLKTLLQDNGIDPEKPVVYYCTGGVRSAYAWMVHCMDGLGPARNYEGGIEAWNKKAVRP